MVDVLEIACPVHHVVETIPVPAVPEAWCGDSENPAKLRIGVVREGGTPKPLHRVEGAGELVRRLTHVPAHVLVYVLGRFLNWRAGEPWLMRPLGWTVATDGIRVFLRCGCGEVVHVHEGG